MYIQVIARGKIHRYQNDGTACGSWKVPERQRGSEITNPGVGLITQAMLDGGKLTHLLCRRCQRDKR